MSKIGLQAFGNALIAYEGGEAEYTQVVRTAILTGELAPFA